MAVLRCLSQRPFPARAGSQAAQRSGLRSRLCGDAERRPRGEGAASRLGHLQPASAATRRVPAAAWIPALGCARSLACFLPPQPPPPPPGPWRPVFGCGAAWPCTSHGRLPAGSSAPAPATRWPGFAATPGAQRAFPRPCCAPTASWAAAGSRPPPPSRCTTRPAAPSWAWWPTAGYPRPAPPCVPPTRLSAAGGGSRPR